MVQNSYRCDVPFKAGEHIAFEFHDAQGRPAETGWVSFDLQPDSGGPLVPHLIPALHPALASALGSLVVYWATLEGVVNLMIPFLLRFNKNPEPGTREFKRRLQLFDDEQKQAFAQHKDLLQYIDKQIIRPIWEVKRIRDLVNHAQIIALGTSGGPTLRFVTHKLGKKNKKLFTEKQIRTLSQRIAVSCGRIDQLASDPSEVPVSSQSKLALQRVLDKDRWSRAIDAALQLPPQSNGGNLNLIG